MTLKMNAVLTSSLWLLAAFNVLGSEQPQQPFDFGNMGEPTSYQLPALPYAYDALEPFISKQIMELHHSKHHQTYINNLNVALKAQAGADITTQLSLQQAIKFNAGGHINHALFWENLTPAKSKDAAPEAAPKLMQKIKDTWGSDAKFRDEFKVAALGIQGSGWVWLTKAQTGVEQRLAIQTTKDQDPVIGKGEVPIFGVDMWEHAYYLQYQNGKAAYVDNIMKIINWRVAEERFLGTREDAFKVLKASF